VLNEEVLIDDFLAYPVGLRQKDRYRESYSHRLWAEKAALITFRDLEISLQLMPLSRPNVLQNIARGLSLHLAHSLLLRPSSVSRERGWASQDRGTIVCSKEH